MENLVNRAFWLDRPTLVTGGTGLVGSWLVRRLLSAGASVVCLVRDWVPQSEMVRKGWIEQVKVVRGDIRDRETLERALGEFEIDTVIHLAAQTIVTIANRNPISTFETNIAGTWNLLEACRRSPRVKQIVVASSDKAYGDQEILPYDESTPLQGQHLKLDSILDDRSNTFDIPAAIISFSGLLYRDYESARNLGFSLSAGASPTQTTNLASASILDANLTYQLLPTIENDGPRFSLTFGQALLPFGLESNTSEELKPVINNAQFVGQTGLGQRQIGLVARGELFTQYDFGYNYRQALLSFALGAVNGTGANRDDDNAFKDVIGRVAIAALRSDRSPRSVPCPDASGGSGGRAPGARGRPPDRPPSAAERRARLAADVQKMGVLKILGAKGEGGLPQCPRHECAHHWPTSAEPTAV